MTTPAQPEAPAEPTVTVGATNNLNQPAHTVTLEHRTQAEPQVFTAEDIAKAREQEKSKVYGRLETLQEQVQRLTHEADERAQAEAAAQAAADEAARKAAEAEMDVRSLLEKREQEFNDRIARLEAERQQERELIDAQRRDIAIAKYREDQIRANEENILPELIDLVASGPTEAEIDASIAGLTARSASILEAAAEQVNLARRDQRTASPTGAPAAGPLDNTTGQKPVTAADIAAMDMDEYKNYRASLGIGGMSRGLFS